MTPRERLFALEQFGIKLGLHNISALCGALNHPQHHFATIHVAGTNGKGSVTAMVERGLRAAGYRTGRYTSPHLSDIEERIALDGVPVDAASFDDAAADIVAVADRLRAEGVLQAEPTFFEATTAMAFEIFRRREVEIAVVEVGLGGRFDATNVVSPVLTAITSIALDHERHLGDTLARIAAEKAGILKAGVPAIVGPLSAEADAVVTETARAVGAPIVRAAPESPRGGQKAQSDGDAVALALNGAYQHDNAAVAVAVLRACAAAGFEVDRTAIVSALTDVTWPARLEWLRVPDLGDVLVDAAHNPAGAAALAQYVLDAAEPMPMVIGVMQDKDVTGLVRALAPAVSSFVATAAASPRALPARALATHIAETAGSRPVTAIDNPEAALAVACGTGGRAIVGGSILLAGPLRAALIARGATPVRYPSKAAPFYLA